MTHVKKQVKKKKFVICKGGVIYKHKKKKGRKNVTL